MHGESADTNRRRIIHGETVANSDKLFSIFEPHTQLYKRGKAGQPMPFGRQVLVFEDAAGHYTADEDPGRHPTGGFSQLCGQGIYAELEHSKCFKGVVESGSFSA